MNSNLKDIKKIKAIAKEILIRCEVLFYESDPPISTNEAKMRTRSAVKRLLTFFCLLSDFMAYIEKKSLPYKALEVGTGYGALIFSSAKLFPKLTWTGVEHPERHYLKNEKYLNLFSKYGCHLEVCDLTQQELPFENDYFSLITFSEVLEHLPIEKVLFVIKEMHRVLCPGGWIVASSPNLVSLLNRIAILRGYGIFACPVPLDYAGGTFGHIRLYTAEEFVSFCKPIGLEVRHIKYESRFLQNKQSRKLIRKIVYKIYWLIEVFCRPITKKLADTWYVVLQKL